MILSILSMTEYDPTIWSQLQIPSALVKQDLIDKICIDCGELELLYSDPNILKYMIKNWSKTEMYVWQKLADTLNLEYNPIYNLDVTYEETRTPNLTHTRRPDITETRTPNLTNTETPNTLEERNPNVTETRTPNITNTESPSDTTTDAVAGFNSSTFENSRKTTRGGTITNVESGTESIATTGSDAMRKTGTIINKASGTETTKETGTETETETGNEKLNVRRYGNQGVTMTQDMIKKEREVAMFSLYEYITNSFKNRFCLMVY